MTNSSVKKKILFVGASGAVASKVLPKLTTEYHIVGISRKQRSLEQYCTAFYTGDLLHDHKSIFQEIFVSHQFEAIIWNPVLYFPRPLITSSREILHTEFDLAVALPLECLKVAMESGFSRGTFIVVTSLLAFGKKPRWGSYSIVKRAQVVLAEYLADELEEKHVAVTAIALGSVGSIPIEKIQAIFKEAIQNNNDTALYKLAS